MQKEYIDGGEGMSLMISAGDRNLGEGQGGMMHVALGDRTLTVATMASMMQQEGFKDMFRMARVVSTHDDGIEDVIRSKRKELRMLYFVAELVAFWTLCIIAFQIAGIGNWISTVSNLLLLVSSLYLLQRNIRPLRRQVARLTASEREEREDKRKHHMAVMAGFFEAMRQRLEQGNDEEE